MRMMRACGPASSAVPHDRAPQERATQTLFGLVLLAHLLNFHALLLDFLLLLLDLLLILLDLLLLCLERRAVASGEHGQERYARYQDKVWQSREPHDRLILAASRTMSMALA